MSGLPAPPATARHVFGDRLPVAEAFVCLLADTGVAHGLIGPREVPRLWERHVLNCAVIEDAFPSGAQVADVGSGAGLPGLALAIARPDLDLVLIEPMLRRTTWLEGAVRDLGLDSVEVRRGRADDLAGSVRVPFLTARAVARLAILGGWCAPLLTAGGTLVAMKGSSAQQELGEDRDALTRLGFAEGVVTEHGGEVLGEPVVTVDLRLDESPAVTSTPSRRRQRGRRARGGRPRGPR